MSEMYYYHPAISNVNQEATVSSHELKASDIRWKEYISNYKLSVYKW